LIEVVVAFVMLSLVLATAFEILTTGFARAADLEDRSRALVLAQSRLAATGVEEAIKEGEARGESEDRRFQWVVTVRKMEDGPDPGNPSIYAMFRVEARVGWRGADARDHSLTLATLALGPRA
jgi:general secretion pathway protein I